MYRLGDDEKYQRVEANAAGRYLIEPLGVELGIWPGHFRYPGIVPWLRWWDAEGNLLPTGEERAERERQLAEEEFQRAEQEYDRAEREHQRAQRETQRAKAAEQELQRAAAAKLHAEQERQRARAAQQQAEQERQQAEQRAIESDRRAARLAERLRAAGIDPDGE